MTKSSQHFLQLWAVMKDDVIKLIVAKPDMALYGHFYAYTGKKNQDGTYAYCEEQDG